MSQRPGHVDVVTEVGFCNFCNRTRNLRRESHRLGGLVRTIVSCETCHRTLSNTMGVAPAEPEPVKEQGEAPAAEPARAPVAEPAAEEKPKPKRAPAKRATTKSAGPTRTTPRGSTGPAAKAKPETPPKPRSTATRKTTRSK